MFITSNDHYKNSIPSALFNNKETDSSDQHKVFDLALLEEMDDNDYLTEIIAIFLKETPADIKEMQEALKKNNSAILAARAHKIKGSAGLMQAGTFIDILVAIEDKAKTGIDKEIADLVESAHHQYNILGSALQDHLVKIQG